MERAQVSLVALAIVLTLTSMLCLRFNVTKVVATEIVVPDDYPTIQQAVNAASDGDIVRVRAGTYIEDIVINGKSLSLIGEGRSNTVIRNKSPGVGD
jgi:pectin methylesterase-like acyl-CoA thioesterase